MEFMKIHAIGPAVAIDVADPVVPPGIFAREEKRHEAAADRSRFQLFHDAINRDHQRAAKRSLVDGKIDWHAIQ